MIFVASVRDIDHCFSFGLSRNSCTGWTLKLLWTPVRSCKRVGFTVECLASKSPAMKMVASTLSIIVPTISVQSSTVCEDGGDYKKNGYKQLSDSIHVIACDWVGNVEPNVNRFSAIRPSVRMEKDAPQPPNS